MIWLIALLFLICLGVLAVIVLKISAQTNLQLNALNSQLNERLKEMSSLLQESQRAVGERLDAATGIIAGVHRGLGKVEEASRQIFEVSKDISSLQNLLKAPKFRGEMGETLLGNLLAEVLPKEHYKLQHQFRSGETVDAIIRLGGHIVSVDAKFSLENFQGLISATSEDEKNSCKKRFINDIKNRINEVSSKYILADEETFDFALMYIPAENVYYEAVIQEDIQAYALRKRVIPVSPNTFYAYLQVICLGLRGLEVERNAKDILNNLSRLKQDLIKFSEDFRLVGSHIKNAVSKYEEAQARLDKFQDKLSASGACGQEKIESSLPLKNGELNCLKKN